MIPVPGSGLLIPPCCAALDVWKCRRWGVELLSDEEEEGVDVEEEGNGKESAVRCDSAALRVMHDADRTAVAAIDGMRDASTMVRDSVMVQAGQGPGDEQGRNDRLAQNLEEKRHDYIMVPPLPHPPLIVIDDHPTSHHTPEVLEGTAELSVRRQKVSKIELFDKRD